MNVIAIGLIKNLCVLVKIFEFINSQICMARGT